ncbi:MAG: 4Fe-4S binding protein [Patescibacteria group bacterium]
MAEKIVPVIDEGSCTGCGGCVDVCKEDAIKIVQRDTDGPMARLDVARINEDTCTGCGDCVGSCGDISLPEEEEA